jgi:hypothetical protein
LAGAAQKVLNKLDSLGRRTGGLFGQSLLVTAEKIPKSAKKRLQEYGYLCAEPTSSDDPKDLLGIKAQLDHWKQRCEGLPR